SSHRSLVAGPVGPSSKNGSFSPQCPAYDNQANSPSFGASRGNATTSGRSRSIGLRVSSHPKPVAPLLPNHRVDEKYEAWEPCAAYTTGCVPSASLIFSSPASAYSAPSCCAYAYRDGIAVIA